MADRAKAKRLAKERMKCNKPKRTPDHKTKSHVVKACKDGEEKIIRFGQQGVKGAGKGLGVKPCVYRGKSFTSMTEAAEYFGVTVGAVSRANRKV